LTRVPLTVIADESAPVHYGAGALYPKISPLSR